MSLGDRLRRRIAADGPLRFDEFMEAALYDPEDGFYARGVALGARGAFATAPTLHPAFADAMAAEVVEGWRSLRADRPALVEAGPGDGTLARLLRQRLAPRRYRHVLVERADGMRRLQEQALAGEDVEWVREPEELGPVDGVLVSNELFDALPVRLLAWPHEVLVGVDERGRFRELRRPASAELLEAVSASGDGRQGGRYAVSPGAAALLERLAAAVRRGRIVTVDYGGEGREVHDGRRDPIRTFVGGQPGGSPLAAPGRQDLTADVDFGALRAAGRRLGLRELVYELQEDWLVRHGARVPPPGERSEDDWRLARLLGARLSFRVLVHERP